MLGAALLGLGYLALRSNPKRRGRRPRRRNAPGVNEHIRYAPGKSKTVCTSHVLAALGIDACQYHYSGQAQQRAAILRRHGFAVRSRMSRLGKRRTVGAARRAIRTMGDPPGTKYMLSLVYGTSYHAILLDADGKTLVDTDPREADRRRVRLIHAVFSPLNRFARPRARNPGQRRLHFKRESDMPADLLRILGNATPTNEALDQTNYHIQWQGHDWGVTLCAVVASASDPDRTDVTLEDYGPVASTRTKRRKK